MNKLIFEKYSDHYELLYKDKDYYAECKYIHNLIIRHSKKKKGGGRSGEFREIL
jgi:hypothetical protein